MTGVMTWLTGTRAGRIVAIVLLAAIAGAAVAWRIAAGRLSQAQARAAEAALRRTVETLDAVRRMGEAQARSPRDRRAVLERLRRGDG